jgi:tRNA threonylcarbamoyladenosine biosynthesis protein TsaB
VATLIDARRDEVYCATFDCHDGRARRLGDDVLLAPEAVLLAPGDDWLAAGNGWDVYRTRLPQTLAALPRASDDLPHAVDVATLARDELAAGRAVDAASALPAYLRGALE